jgi:endonuclease/exonuclease/phosphatase family metal-dependent hydrolase
MCLVFGPDEIRGTSRRSNLTERLQERPQSRTAPAGPQRARNDPKYEYWERKYPPAEPGALGLEPLKAACRCRFSSALLPTARNASPKQSAQISLPRPLITPTTYIRTSSWCGLKFLARPSMGNSLLCGWRLMIRSLVDGPADSTAGYVKLLLPPRQSRRNSFIGLGTITRATPDTLPAAAAKFYTETVATKPKDRAAAIANEIKDNAPDLIAFQEVGILRKGSGATPNDPKIPATEVVHDQLQLLLEALSELGEHYDTVAVIPNSDVQLPSTLDFVVRLTDRTVILARASSNRLKLSNVQVEQFSAQPAVSSPFTGRFGWGSVDVEVGDLKFRFASTHLTPVALDQPQLIVIQKAQALELIQSAGKPDLPGGPVLPVVYAGDFNTVAGLDTYKILVDNSVRIDAWQKKNPMASCPEPRHAGDHDRSGCTCCQDPNLSNPTSKLDHRVDLLIVPRDTEIALAELVGADQPDQTSGLWQSDHAGLVATFKPPIN